MFPFDHRACSLGLFSVPTYASVHASVRGGCYTQIAEGRKIRSAPVTTDLATRSCALADPISSMHPGTLVPLPLPSAFPPHGPTPQPGPSLACCSCLCFPTAGSVSSQVLSVRCKGYQGCLVASERSLPVLQLYLLPRPCCDTSLLHQVVFGVRLRRTLHFATLVAVTVALTGCRDSQKKSLGESPTPFVGAC